MDSLTVGQEGERRAVRAQSGKAWRGHLNRAESVGKGVEAKGASRLGPAPQQPTQGRPCRAPVLWVCKAPRRSPSRGPHGDTHRALRGHPLAEPLESAATARFPASAQCPGDVPTAPSEPHPGSPLLSAKRTASPPPTHSSIVDWCSRPHQALDWSPVWPGALRHPKSQTSDGGQVGNRV